MKKLSVKDLAVKGKTVLVRADCNVPLDKNANITDTARLQALEPTITYLLENSAKIIIMSHLGRPKGEVIPELSLQPIAEDFAQRFHCPVKMAPDCVGPEVTEIIKNLKEKEIVLLENLRFHPGETDSKKEPGFAEKLAELADFYVNDAFGTSHRTHTSVVAVAQQFPKKAAAGLLLNQEIQRLSSLLSSPKKPFVALVGGAKISTKIGILTSLCQKVDALLIGGAMAHTFLLEKQCIIGKSFVEKDLLDKAREVIQECEKNQVDLLLPTDLVVADGINSVTSETVSVAKGVADQKMALDIGPETVKNFSAVLQGAKTVFWNGPTGCFEHPPFDKGTKKIAEILSKSAASVVVGGGDSIAAIRQQGLQGAFSHLSTGGGACLEWIEFGHLPGIDVLTNSENMLQNI